MSNNDKDGFLISYTAADVAWADWINWHLRKAGFYTIMQQNGSKAEKHKASGEFAVLAVLSTRYFNSAFCTNEWTDALKQQHAKGERQLVSIQIEECRAEEILGPITYIDLVGLDGEKAKARLLEGIAGTRHPIDKPLYPATSTTPSPGFPGILPEIWNIPHRRNRAFTGRDEILEQLHKSLSSGNPAVLVQAISGLGGVGKTQLAFEYAYRFSSDYSGIWWIRSQDPTVLAADYMDLAVKLRLPEANAQELKASQKQARQDEIDRNAVEGKFGQGKRRYSLSRIMTKLSHTSETAIMLSFLVMNLKRWLATLLFFIFHRARELLTRRGFCIALGH